MKKWMFSTLLVFVCLIGMVRISYAEISSITIVPVHTMYVLRNIPWTSEEKPMFQFTVSGEEPDMKNVDYSFQAQVLMNDSIIHTNSNRSVETAPRTTRNYESTLVVQTDTLPPGKYTFKLIVKDNNSSQILSKETTFEVVDDQNLRILNLRLVNINVVLAQPLFFKNGDYAFICRLSSVAEWGDYVSVAVSFKEKPQTVCGLVERINARGEFLVPFTPTTIGKHILVVKAVDKTKNLEVEYELPVIVVDPREIME